MSEDAKSGGSGSSSEQSTFGVPAAIVIAGGLIAAAIYFGGGRAAVAVPTDSYDADDEVAAADDHGDRAGAGAVAGERVGEIRPVGENDLVRGSKDAKITVIEYSDLECPFCKRFHPTLAQVLEEYPNDVRWVYRHFPLEQLHVQATAEAEAVVCAQRQGKGWELLDLIFEITPGNDGLDLDQLPVFAEQVGVPNIAQFESCIDNGEAAEQVEADIADAAAAGGRGTPYSVILGPDGEKIPVSGAQPFASVKAQIDSLL